VFPVVIQPHDSESSESSSKRLPRYRRLANYQTRIGRPEHKILAVVASFHYLSALQVTSLLFADTSLKYVRESLKELYQGQYLQRVYLPRITPQGSSLAIYCLDKKGLAYLRKVGLAPGGRLHTKEEAEREWLFLEHTLAANHLIIHCHNLGKSDPASQLVRFVSERELKRQPGSVRLAGRKVAVIPDGWVHVSKQWPGSTAPNHYYIAWELDRGTIRQAAFRRKIRALVTWIQHGYVEQFGVEGLTVAFVTTVSPRRLEQMVSWTAAELDQLKARDYADLFLFSHLEPKQTTPSFLLSEAHWVQPYTTRLAALIEPPGE
jgi:hypothetical protein